MSDTEELHIGDFNPSTYEHVLPEGAHDFNDYDSEYEEQHPELGFTDEQVEAEVAKLDPEDKKFYEEYRKFLDTYYRQHGKIIEMPDLIKLIITGRYPEIPSTTRKEQDELREKLMIETRKREMSQQAGVVIGKTLPSRKPSPLQEHKIFGCRYLIRRGVHRKMVITTVYLRVRCMSLT